MAKRTPQEMLQPADIPQPVGRKILLLYSRLPAAFRSYSSFQIFQLECLNYASYSRMLYMFQSSHPLRFIISIVCKDDTFRSCIVRNSLQGPICPYSLASCSQAPSNQDSRPCKHVLQTQSYVLTKRTGMLWCYGFIVALIV